MFKDMKLKTQKLKDFAERKKQEVDLEEIKASLERSTAKVAASVQTSKEVMSDATVQVRTQVESKKRASNEAIKSHWPKIEKVLVEGLIGVAEEKLNDEHFLTSTFESMYELLPTPVRLVLGREKFLKFCLANKSPILAKVNAYKAKREQMQISNDTNQA